MWTDLPKAWYSHILVSANGSETVATENNDNETSTWLVTTNPPPPPVLRTATSNCTQMRGCNH